MAYKKVKRVVRRYAQKAGSALKKRYFKGKGYSQPKLVQMAKDVSVLKSMLNAEKKRLEVTISDGTVGQVNGNSSGHYLYDLTPVVAQGTGYNQKTGNSFKWHSTFLDFQFIAQSALSNRTRLKIELVKVVGQPFSTVSDILAKYIEPTAFTSGTVYDLNSPRDPDYFKNYVVLKRKYVTINAETVSSQLQMARVKMGLKLKNHHVRTDNNTATVTMGQIFMIITADNGNVSTGTASTITGIPNTAINTGITFRSEFTYYFYDN